MVLCNFPVGLTIRKTFLRRFFVLCGFTPTQQFIFKFNLSFRCKLFMGDVRFGPWSYLHVEELLEITTNCMHHSCCQKQMKPLSIEQTVLSKASSVTQSVIHKRDCRFPQWKSTVESADGFLLYTESHCNYAIKFQRWITTGIMIVEWQLE